MYLMAGMHCTRDQLPRKAKKQEAHACASWKQHAKTFLRKVPVVGEYVRETFTAHHVHRNAIGEAVFLVGSGFVEGQAIQEHGLRWRQNVYPGVLEDLARFFRRALACHRTCRTIKRQKLGKHPLGSQ